MSPQLVAEMSLELSPAEPEVVTAAGARCAIHRDAPSWQGLRSAAIGSFACATAAEGAALLEDVCGRLGAEGFAAAIGPMNGDTWHAYRLVTQSDGSPSFPLEPVSGLHDLAAFEGAGFTAISSYLSARTQLQDAPAAGDDPGPPGLRVENWDGQDAAGLIGRVYDMSLAAFARNAFYKPITREAFLDLYRPVIPAIDARFVLFARRTDGSIAGFLFGYPNVLEGPRPASVVIKTYASAERGAGRLMAQAFHRSARELGFRHVIHALMHVDNVSRDRSSRHGGQVFRRYALMGRRLAQRA